MVASSKKRVALTLIAVFVAVMGIATAYAATSYKTYLSLGAGYYQIGSPRYYSAGKPELEVNVNYFNKYNNQDYSNMLYKFLTSGGDTVYETTVWLAPQIVGDTVTLTNNFGRVSAGNYKWYFSTKVNGTTYSGFYMDPVYLKTV